MASDALVGKVAESVFTLSRIAVMLPCVAASTKTVPPPQAPDSRTRAGVKLEPWRLQVPQLGPSRQARAIV